jgi:nucleoid-associated protein YgaU
MGFLGGKDERRDKPAADFGNVKSGKTADFSDVQSGSSSTAPNADRVSADSGRTYVVVKGDSLSKIAKREYGDAEKWHEIYEANADTIKDPDLIYPGQKLRLP